MDLNPLRSIPRHVIRCWDDLLGLGFPDVCQFCGEESAVKEEGYLGRACRKFLRPVVEPYCERCGLPLEGEAPPGARCANCDRVPWYSERARSALLANPFALDVVHRYKYQEALWVEEFLVGILAEAVRQDSACAVWDGVLSVPLHATRRRERYFNQADHLARGLAHALGRPYLARAMKRIAPTASQTMLTRQERARNVRAAFQVVLPHAIVGRRLLLVDDVLTTGATTNACAKVLRRAGARQVWVWTLLRGTLRTVVVA